MTRPLRAPRGAVRVMWWAASGAVILFAVLGLVAVIVFGGDNDPANAGPSTPATDPVSTAASPPTGNTGNCPTMPANDNVPTAAPDAAWELTNGTALPTAPEVGPRTIEGPIARCFAHSPTGGCVRRPPHLISQQHAWRRDVWNARRCLARTRDRCSPSKPDRGSRLPTRR